MSGAVGEVLLGIRTVAEMIAAFADEERSRRLLEAMVWPNGRVCPACGYKRSIALAGRDMGRYRARAGLYQCSNGACRFQFTVTTRTPLHATKLPLSTWLKALWLILQSDKGLSSIRLAEALGVSQPTAWRIGHALRLMLARENPLAARSRSMSSLSADGRRIGLTSRRRAAAARVCDGPQSARSWRWYSGLLRPRWARPAVVANLSMR
jgi:transposase-like protein